MTPTYRRGSNPNYRHHSEPPRRRWVPDTDAVNQVAEPVVIPHRERTWWQDIIDSLWHAWRAHELCDTWTLIDLADEMADQLWTEAQRLTATTEELVPVPIAAIAAVAQIRKGKESVEAALQTAIEMEEDILATEKGE